MAASDTTNSLLMQYMDSMANLGGRNNPTEKMQNYDVQSVLEDIPSWDKDSKYPPDIMDAILNKDYNPDQSFIDTAIGLTQFQILSKFRPQISFDSRLTKATQRELPYGNYRGHSAFEKIRCINPNLT